MSRHLFGGVERPAKTSVVLLSSSEFIVKQTIITACLPPRVVPSAFAPLDSGVVPYFQPTTSPHFPPSTFAHSPPQPCVLLGSPYLGQRCAVNGVLLAAVLAADRARPLRPLDSLPTP